MRLASGTLTDPAAHLTGVASVGKVVRGGSWGSRASDVRARLGACHAGTRRPSRLRRRAVRLDDERTMTTRVRLLVGATIATICGVPLAAHMLTAPSPRPMALALPRESDLTDGDLILRLGVSRDSALVRLADPQPPPTLTSDS